MFFKQLLKAILGIALCVFLSLWWLRATTNHGQKITVPDLNTMTLDAAISLLEENDLRYAVLDSSNYNPDYPPYTIIEQTPLAGHAVKENRKIYLTINASGFRKIEVPNVVEKTLRQAEPTLRASGFKLGTVSYVPHVSDQVQAMRFKGEEINPGTLLEKTSAIDLVVGDGSLNRLRRENLPVVNDSLSENQ